MVPTSQASTPPSASSHDASPHPPILLRLPSPEGEEVRGEGEEVRSQTSEVSEEAAAAPSPPPTSDLRPLTSGPDLRPLSSAALSPDALRDLVDLAETLACDVRPRVLLDLASAGPANVGLLAARTGIDPNTLSHHLGKLKDKGLLDCRRKGKEHWYEPVPTRIRYERQGDGGFALTIVGRGGGVRVALTIAESGLQSR